MASTAKNRAQLSLRAITFPEERDAPYVQRHYPPNKPPALVL
jgi:hypothetical protein